MCVCVLCSVGQFGLDYRISDTRSPIAPRTPRAGLTRDRTPSMSIQFQSQNFQHILRMCNTNVDGRQKVVFVLLW